MKKFFKNIKDSLRTVPLTMKSIFLIDFIGIISILFFYLDLDFIFITENIIYLFVSLSLPLIFTFFKIYEPIVGHITFSDLKKTSYVFILWSITFLIIFPNFKNPYFFLIFIYLFLIGYRLLIKDFFNENKNIVAKPIILYGAGELGIFTKRALYNSSRYSVKGFIDDNEYLFSRKIEGVKIFSPSDPNLIQFINQNKIEYIIIANTKLPINRKKYLTKFFQKELRLKILEIPDPKTWIEKQNLNEIKGIEIKDLLERKEIETDFKQNLKLYSGKTILVSGGAGSIGSEIVNQLLFFKPKNIVVLDINESGLFDLNEKFKSFKSVKIYLCNVTNKVSLDSVFKKYNIDIVFHAAAYKHVPMVEKQPLIGLRNNIFGTKNIIDISIKHKIDCFVLVSTDKAVNPTNVMGASKRFCELLCSINAELQNETKFITTRFGNVLGSSGSVVPIFKKQIDDGGPITITHPEITRYFMTIPEACQLVIEAGRIGKSGQILVFDMGKPIKIYDLAINMIYLSGLTPFKDIEVDYIGLRPGEKLYEELLLKTEGLTLTKNKHVFIGSVEKLSAESKSLIEKYLIDLEKKDYDEITAVKFLKSIIPEFVSNNSKFKKLDEV